MNRQWMQFTIGLVTLVSLIALGTIIIWFGEVQVAFERRSEYFVAFSDAPGLEPKVLVRRAGMRIGEVTAVDYDDSRNQVVATLSLDSGQTLREGDEPTLTRTLLGETYVDVMIRDDMKRRPNRPVLVADRSYIIEGRSPVDLMQDLPSVTETIDSFRETSKQWGEVGKRTNRILDQNEQQINSIAKEMEDALRQLNSTIASVNRVLDDRTQDNIRVTIENLRKTSEDLGPMVEQTRKAIEEISNTTGKLDEIAGNLEKATAPLASRSESVMRNLDEVTGSLNVLLNEVRTITERVTKQDGTLQRLLADPGLYQNLDDAAALLVGNLSQLQMVLADIKVFSDKIARHPGELGVQGVFTRDTGLKNAPPDRPDPGRGLRLHR